MTDNGRMIYTSKNFELAPYNLRRIWLVVTCTNPQEPPEPIAAFANKEEAMQYVDGTGDQHESYYYGTTRHDYDVLEFVVNE